MTPAGEVNLRVFDVVARTVRELPRKEKRAQLIFAMCWTGVIVLQLWDSLHRPNARGIAEFGSVVLGTLGVGLFGFAGLLKTAASRAKPGEHSISQMIWMAVPAVSATSAALLGAGMALLVARIWLGDSRALLLIAVAYSMILVGALHTVTEAARRLYLLGQAEAARASQMEVQLAAARVSALQAQMNPHFLFNALNTVASLTQSNPKLAEATIEDLAQVLRGTLDRSQQSTCSLEDEMSFVRAYLDVESRRLGPRLTVDWRVPDEMKWAAVPSFSLQPLIENSIEHGIGPRREGGRISISAQRKDGKLLLAVEDNGDGFDAHVEEGTGLGNLRERLAVMYRGAASLSIERLASGARVVIEVPLRTAMKHAAADR